MHHHPSIGIARDPKRRYLGLWPLCLLWCLTIASAIAGAQLVLADTVDLEPHGFQHDLAPDIRYLEDAGKALTIDDVLRLDRAEAFSPVQTKLVDFGFSRSRYWLSAVLHNPTPHAATWRLAIELPYIEQLDVYAVHREGNGPPSYEKLLSYDEDSAFGARGLAYRYFAPEISLPAGASEEIVMAYSSKQATQVPISIESPDHFSQRIRTEDLVNISLLALLAGMTLVSTLYLMALGFHTAIFYGVYVLLAGLYLFHTDGYAFQYIWPNWPIWNSVAVAPIGLAMVASGSLFARSFVDAPANFPRLNMFLLGTVAIIAVLMLASPWIIQTRAYKIASLLFVILCAVFYLSAGILALRRGQAGAGFFLAGSIAIVSTILFGIFGYLNPGEFNQDIAGYYARYALFFEGVAFSLAIFLHIQALRREHEDALVREVEATREKLAISEALNRARSDHQRAVHVAETRRGQIAAAAHDIKQPLTSLRMALTRMDTGDPKTAEHIRHSFDYLDELVRSNLEKTTPGSDRDALEGVGDDGSTADERDGHPHESASHGSNENEDFPVNVVLDNVVAMFRDEARSKGVALDMVPSRTRVHANPLALMRIVSNLVSNAVKYSESGRVLIGCRRHDNAIRVEIHDTGPGIPEDELERLKRPYERGVQPGGTGLGLALVEDLAKSNGLDFDIRSIVGKGTVSTVTVAVARQGAGEDAA